MKKSDEELEKRLVSTNVEPFFSDFGCRVGGAKNTGLCQAEGAPRFEAQGALLKI